MMMRFEYWFDVSCPFCFIAHQRLLEAVSLFQDEPVSIIYKAYQLQPGLPKESNEDYLHDFARIHHLNIAQVQAALSSVTKMAHEANLSFNWEKAHLTNTMDAHLLIQFALTKERANEVVIALFKAYFLEGKNIANRAVLESIAKSFGLLEKNDLSIWDETSLSQKIIRQQKEAEHYQIQGVPYLIVNRKYSIIGLQTTQHYLNVMKSIWRDSFTESPTTDVEQTTYCVGDRCYRK